MPVEWTSGRVESAARRVQEPTEKDPRAHLSVKPDTSMNVAYPTSTKTVFRNTGFWTIHQRPRGATS